MSGILGALLEADLTVQLRNGRALLLTFFPPLAVLYGLSTAKRGAQLGGPIVNVALALTLGIALIAILGYTASVARDRELGVFQRLRVTPAPTWTIMLSRLAVQILSMLAMTRGGPRGGGRRRERISGSCRLPYDPHDCYR